MSADQTQSQSQTPTHRDRHAVVGNPVAHSKSPAIHAQFAQETGEAVDYDRLLAPLDGFVEHVRRWRSGRARSERDRAVQARSARARASSVAARMAAAVTRCASTKTAFWRQHRRFRPRARHRGESGVSLKGARVLLLGAGGAARGVVLPLLDACRARSPSSIARRKAHALVEQFAGRRRRSAA
jgi:shikimate dehydrogenase